MTSRTRLIITALLWCHLFLRPGVVTSQLPAAGQQQNSGQPANPPAVSNSGPPAAPAQPQPAAKPQVTVRTDTGQEDTETEQIIEQELQETSPQEQGPPRPAINAGPARNEVLIRADEQEKNQDIYSVRGHVEIRFSINTLHCDQATYDSTSGQVTAIGHVVFDGGPHNEHIVGSRASYNISRDSGTFYDATGSTGAKVKNHMMFLTSSTPFFFTGKVVERLEPDHYRVYYGFITSCQLPNPKWQLDSKVADVEIGAEAKMHHATMKLHGIPVFYFPFVEHPAENFGRKSGFLIPVAESPTARGTVLGDAFYWVISRNADATIGASIYSARGPAGYGNFRWIGFGSAFQAQFTGVQDNKGNPQTGQNQGGEELRLTDSGLCPTAFWVCSTSTFSRLILFRLAFAEGFTEAINSEVRSNGFVMKNWDGYSFGVIASRYQNYESTAPNDDISIVHAPSVDFSTAERPFSRSGFVYSYNAEIGGVNRSEIGFSTAPMVDGLTPRPILPGPSCFAAGPSALR